MLCDLISGLDIINNNKGGVILLLKLKNTYGERFAIGCNSINFTVINALSSQPASAM